MNIERTFHRVWISDGPEDVIPPHLDVFWDKLQELHPSGWEFRTWTRKEDLDWLRCRAVFDAATTHAGRSDVVRAEVVARFGGVYLDCDVEPLRPFDELLEDPRPFAGWEDKRMICNAVFGAPAGHPAIEAVVKAMPRWAARRPGAPPNQQTGPHLWTHLWRHRPDVRLFEPVVFFPIHWSNKVALGGPYPPESFAEHKWEASWLEAEPPQRVPR